MVEFALASDGSRTIEALVAGWATDEDRLQAQRRLITAARSRTLAIRALMRWLLEVSTGLDGRAWRVLADGSGKPRLLAPDGEKGPAVSLSHSGGTLACAVTRRGAVGLDVEAHRPGRRVLALADLAFGDRERAEVFAGGPAAFYRIWTLREAMAKATGAGLSRAANRRDQVPGSPGSGAWTTTLDDEQWLLAYLEPRAGLSLALAVLPRRNAGGKAWSLGSLRDLSHRLP